MGYGYFDEDTIRNGGGSAFDPNKVTSTSTDLPYSGYGGGGGGSFGGYDTQPASAYSPGGGAFNGQGGQQSSGLGGNMWTAIFGMIGDRLQGRLNAFQNADAARAAIPSPAYAQTLKGFIDQQALEGKMLADSKLGPQATAAASAVGSRAANARGLSGPLAASVQAESVNQAQGNYNQWRLGMLQNYRQSYLGLVQQYLAALEARRQAQQQAGYADRESFFAKLPIGPIGKALGEGIANASDPYGQWNPYSSSYINRQGSYNGAVPNF